MKTFVMSNIISYSFGIVSFKQIMPMKFQKGILFYFLRNINDRDILNRKY